MCMYKLNTDGKYICMYICVYVCMCVCIGKSIHTHTWLIVQVGIIIMRIIIIIIIIIIIMIISLLNKHYNTKSSQ